MSSNPVDSLPLKVLFLLFPGFNTLDFNGPLEALFHAAKRTAFKCTIAAATELTTASENCTIQRHISLEEALTNLSEYDVLVVPGGPATAVHAQADANTAFSEIIVKFSRLSSSPGRKEKVLMSICSGSLFLGETGVLRGHMATTHWAVIDDLRYTCTTAALKMGGKSTEVVRARWVDAGCNEQGIRIITAGGVSCGLDASFHLINLKAGKTVAEDAAKNMDYRWRAEEGIVVEL